MKLPAMFPRVRDPLNRLLKTTPSLLRYIAGTGRLGLI